MRSMACYTKYATTEAALLWRHCIAPEIGAEYDINLRALAYGRTARIGRVGNHELDHAGPKCGQLTAAYTAAVSLMPLVAAPWALS